MNRAARRQRLRVVHSRENERSGVPNARTAALIAAVNVDAVVDDPADHAFVTHMKMESARRVGLPSVAWSMGAVYLVARRVVTGERLGCFSVTIMPPEGKALVEDFFVVPGRWGTVAAYAMIEKLRALKPHKVCFTRIDNERMVSALERAGMHVTGYVMEG